MREGRKREKPNGKMQANVVPARQVARRKSTPLWSVYDQETSAE
jgi:hypothetical protein